MRTPIQDYLQRMLDIARPDISGARASYIPELRDADPDKLGMAICTISGNIYSAGDDQDMFTIQSISKPFAYALALKDRGLEAVSEVVGTEPSGEDFNELSLDGETHRPMNPMINAGAIAINQLINGEDSSVEDRMAIILDFFSQLAGRPLEIDKRLCDSEFEAADRNLALAHMLRSYGIIRDTAHDAVYNYVQQCSVLVNVQDLAVMGATLANGGVQPITGERVLTAEICRQVQSVMTSAGMYNGAGQWLFDVGIPAKSGVSGGILGTLPGQLGIATFSPRLDSKGNSVRGVKVFEQLSHNMGLHLMATEPFGGDALRDITKDGDTTTIHAQGTLNFSAAEELLHSMHSPGSLPSEGVDRCRVVVDLSEVSRARIAGSRILLDGISALIDEGHDVAVYDPHFMLKSYELEDGTDVETIENPDY